MKKTLLLISVTILLSIGLQAQEWNFGNDSINFPDYPGLPAETTVTINGLSITSGPAVTNMGIVEPNQKTIGTTTYHRRFKFNGGGYTGAAAGDLLPSVNMPTQRYISFPVTGNRTILVHGITGSSSSARKLFVTDGTNYIGAMDFPASSGTLTEATLNYTGPAATLYIFCSNSVNLYYLNVTIPAAPTPPVRTASKVISIFSDAYAPIPGITDFNPSWGQTTVQSQVKLGTDNALKYKNLDYQGTSFGSDVVAIPMKYLHVDVYSADETSLQVFCISHTTGEKFVQLTPIVLDAWNSYDIPLTDFTSQGLSIGDLFQFKFVGSGGKTVYLDNLYFYTDAVDDTEAPTAFTVTKGVVTSESVEFLLNATDNSGAVSYEISYGAGPTVLTTAGVSAVTKSYVVSGLDPTTDYSFSVSASDVFGNAAANNPVVVTATTLTPIPASPIPTVDAAKVISIFSGAYTDLTETNFAPGWGQTTVVSETTLGGDAVKKYSNFNYIGIELKNHIDASAMTTLHVDLFTQDETVIRVTPISPGKEFSILLTPLTQNVWNSYDLPLSSFTGVVMSDLYQFKFDNGTGKTVYMDNLFLYDSRANVSLTLNVDMNGVTLVSGDKIYVAGTFPAGEWNEPGTNAALEMLDGNADGIYTITMQVPVGTKAFKFFKNAGWNGGEWTGDPNRSLEVTGDLIANYVWGSNGIVGVRDNKQAGKIQMYPNPVRNILTVNSTVDFRKVIITNTLGKVVGNMVYTNDKTINTSGLSRGMYFVTFVGKDGSKVTQKLIKE